MDHHLESHPGIRDAEQFLSQDEMPRGRYRQKLGQSLKDTEDDGVKIRHK